MAQRKYNNKLPTKIPNTTEAKRAYKDQVKTIIENNKRKGVDYRTGLPKSLKVGDKTVGISNVTKVAEGQVDRVGFVDLDKKKITKKTRYDKLTKIQPETQKWLDRLTKEGKWPEGLSEKGFKTWMANAYKAAQTAASRFLDPHQAGHGLSAKEGGPNTPSNLANQPRSTPKSGPYGTIKPNLGDRGKSNRSISDLQRAGRATNQLEALSEYLLKNQKNIQQPTRFTPSQNTAILHGTKGTAEGISLQADRDRADQALRSKIRAANKNTLTKAGWIGKNSINSRSNVNLNTGLRSNRGGGSFERIKTDLDFIENDMPVSDQSLLNSPLFEPKEIMTIGGPFSGV